MTAQKIELFCTEKDSFVDALFHDEMKDEQFESAEASWAPELH